MLSCWDPIIVVLTRFQPPTGTFLYGGAISSKEVRSDLYRHLGGVFEILKGREVKTRGFKSGRT